MLRKVRWRGRERHTHISETGSWTFETEGGTFLPRQLFYFSGVWSHGSPTVLCFGPTNQSRRSKHVYLKSRVERFSCSLYSLSPAREVTAAQRWSTSVHRIRAVNPTVCNLTDEMAVPVCSPSPMHLQIIYTSAVLEISISIIHWWWRMDTIYYNYSVPSLSKLVNRDIKPRA